MISVMLCCNDSYGRFTGHVTNVDFGDRELALACHDERGISANRNARLLDDDRLTVDRIKIGRRWFAAKSWTDCVGNVYWSQVTMPVDEAQRLARYLIDERGWTIEEQVIGGPFGAKA